LIVHIVFQSFKGLPPFNSAAIVCRWDNVVAMLVFTPDELLFRGLAVFKYTPVRQNSVSKERNLERFANYIGKSPEALACLWDDLQSTQIEAARVKGTEKMFYYYLMSLFLAAFSFFLVTFGHIWSHKVAFGRK
jgi:hypothetical protein